MRKVGLIILILLYTIPSLGLNVTLHFCGGKYDHFSFGKDDGGTCGCGKGSMKKGCCKDIHFDCSLSEKQVTPESFVIPTSDFQFIPDKPSFTLETTSNYDFFNENLDYFEKVPPTQGNIPIFLVIRSIRI